ncbi:MAG: lipoyl synthase, partial [Deltaproteobacteria bacterium]
MIAAVGSEPSCEEHRMEKVRQIKPAWLTIRPPGGGHYHELKRRMRRMGLATVCEEARCPNVAECWGAGTATFMLMGEICTRGCRFCAVTTRKRGETLDPMEPWKITQAVREMGLDYVVLTSVDRDDLEDGGAGHFARTIELLRYRCPDVLVEVLIPDFQGDEGALDRIVEAAPAVIAHNLETTASLTPKVRDPRCTYEQSLQVLAWVKRREPRILTKSSLMLGLGEGEEEVVQAMRDLRAADVDILTLGQYLRPTPRHLPVAEYLPPERFEHYRAIGEAL